jgi:hypothetical protein
LEWARARPVDTEKDRLSSTTSDRSPVEADDVHHAALRGELGRHVGPQCGVVQVVAWKRTFFVYRRGTEGPGPRRRNPGDGQRPERASRVVERGKWGRGFELAGCRGGPWRPKAMLDRVTCWVMSNPGWSSSEVHRF